MQIKTADLNDQRVIDLLESHFSYMQAISPPGSGHAFSIDKIKQSALKLWCAYDDDIILGCGGLKEITPSHGEIKSMCTHPNHLRKGIGSVVLDKLIQESMTLGYKQLSLETGSSTLFAPAQNFYANCGFEVCGPFGDYCEDIHSVFMTRIL
ncbi:MAG: GNAT family N-acetyltransferase [Legionellales bacterium]|nr:GNAT family N-acetyltransferase [Legionellales bacterium]|tara:strand:+ start:11100 stop:11555 length:456 start_codon:yes stop_codon:yes gene_type:complete